MGFNQENMAKYLDCSVRSIKSYESGAIPSSEVFLKSAKSGIDTTWLLARQVNRPNIVNIYNVEFSAGSLNTKYSPWLIEYENLFKIVGRVKAGICRTK